MPLSLAKYLPSYLASQLSPEELQDSTNVPVMPIPPMLEGEQSLEQIRALAADRDDDICEIGAFRPKDESENMQLVAQGCQEYGQLYVIHASTFRHQPSSMKATNSPGMGEAASSDENRVPLFTFLRGDSQAPKGHAIFIAHSSADSHTVLATYCVIPPTPLSLTKYLPSFLASQLSQEELQDATNVPVMPVPPMLEEGSTLEQLEMLAERRDDDLVDLGSINPRDEAARMQLVAQNCQEYGQLYVKRTSTLQPEPPVTVETTSSNEIVLSHRIHLFTLPFCHVIADKHLRTTLTNWLQGAAAAGWSIPLALAHDLGLLLCLPASQRTIARPTYLPFNEDTSAYLACLERLDAHPLMRELSSWSPPLSDSVISVLLARLIEGLDFPQEYRIPGGAEGKRFLRALEYEMAHTDPAILWEQMPQEARPSWNSLLPANALDRLERNLQALNREEVRFLAHYGPGVSGSLDPRTLLDLLALTGLPDTTRLALSQTLSLLPHVSDSTVLHFGGIQTYPEGGYEGVARQGSLESLLPSENAYTDEIFLHRVLNQEALYYGRERPRAQRREIAYLVGQLGWGLGGDGQVLMRALLLALNQAMQQRGYDVFYSLAGATLTSPATLEKPEEVGRLLYVQEHGSVNSELILRSVLANLRSWRSHYLRRHVFWVLGENFDADTVQEHTSLYRELQAEGEQQVWYIRVGQVPAQSDDVESPPVTARRFGRWQIMESGRIWGDEKAVIS